MKNLRLFLLFFILALCSQGYSQMGVTSYSIYALGINTSQNKMISGELKTFANHYIEDLQFETDIFYNFKAKPYHRFSIGLGVTFEPFLGDGFISALTLPVSLEIYPLKDFKKVSILFELTPEYLDENEFDLRSLWGIRYTFGD